MYNYELKLEKAREEGIHLPAGIDDYLSNLRKSGLDIVEEAAAKYGVQAATCSDRKHRMIIMSKLLAAIELLDVFDESLCDRIDDFIGPDEDPFEGK